MTHTSLSPLRDCLGNTTSVHTPEALAGINDFILGFLRYNKCITRIIDTASMYSDGLVHIYAGLLWMLSETGDTPLAARQHAHQARMAPALNEREHLLLNVLEHWLENDMPAVLRFLKDILQRWPQDLVALKIHQYDDFNNGRALDMLRVTELCLQAGAENAHFHGMHAFAYEQCHLLEHAEHAARRALALDPQEAWAQHALAHVMLTQGRIKEGAAFLNAQAHGWHNLTSFLYTHLWWHKALFHISLGKTETALQIYDQHCWARDRTFSQDQAGAVSLLLRLEFAGMDIKTRWQDLGTYLIERKQDISQPFLSLHYLYGLLRAGRPEGLELLQTICLAAESGSGDPASAVWQDVGLRLAEAMAAHAQNRLHDVLPQLDPVLGRIEQIGGSHAQRDLFEQLALDTLIRTREDGRAQQLLESRRRHIPDDVPTNCALADIYHRNGLGILAQEARARLPMERQRSGIKLDVKTGMLPAAQSND